MPLKPCNDNQIRNPNTNRCVSKTGAIGKRVIKANAKTSSNVPTTIPSSVPVSVPSRHRVKTLEDHIANLRIMYPSIPINTALENFPFSSNDSDEIRASRIPVFNNSPPCPEGKIKNPKTKKCLNINTKSGRQILDYLRKKYYEDSQDDYLSNDPLTIQYDNRQLTIPGFDSLNLETDIPQSFRSCPSGTVRDPDNPNKCIKINSKKGKEIMLNYRKYYDEVRGDIYSIPNYREVPDFLDKYHTPITIPAIYKFPKKKMKILDEIRQIRIEALELERRLLEEQQLLEYEMNK